VLSANVQSIFSGFLELVLMAGLALYAGLVVVSYLSYGPRPRPRVDLHDPAHAAEHLAVWLGVKILALAVGVGSWVFGMLSEASAEVGDWFLSHRRPETR
jgi:hypothetical protein